MGLILSSIATATLALVASAATNVIYPVGMKALPARFQMYLVSEDPLTNGARLLVGICKPVSSSIISIRYHPPATNPTLLILFFHLLLSTVSVLLARGVGSNTLKRLGAFERRRYPARPQSPLS